MNTRRRPSISTSNIPIVMPAPSNPVGSGPVTSLAAMYRHAAIYVCRISNGSKPPDLAAEQSTTCEMVINAKTALALRNAIVQPLLLRADEVIQ